MPAKKITKGEQKRLEILDYIKRTVSETGIPPSVREICAAVDLKSSSTVHIHLKTLEARGDIKYISGKKRTLLPATAVKHESEEFTNVPILGQVAAGIPISAIEDIEGFVPFPVSKSSSSGEFALRIKGDSMVGAGILNGDIVIVKKTPIAENGEIIVTLIGDEATCKRFYRENGGFVLKSENPIYEPMFFRELSILGKVVSVIRYYK